MCARPLCVHAQPDLMISFSTLIAESRSSSNSCRFGKIEVGLYNIIVWCTTSHWSWNSTNNRHNLRYLWHCLVHYCCCYCTVITIGFSQQKKWVRGMVMWEKGNRGCPRLVVDFRLCSLGWGWVRVRVSRVTKSRVVGWRVTHDVSTIKFIVGGTTGVASHNILKCIQSLWQHASVSTMSLI